ncbi:hypothetical protein [Streptomyces beigongshangae]|uniref:hypothetical protein n=1 Tax=Streptomyces beigongshangae TaxID=2841597 RepID=UPI001C858FA7|nr:hypothetical protein [Streptomyces sp. REN17]
MSHSRKDTAAPAPSAICAPSGAKSAEPILRSTPPALSATRICPAPVSTASGPPAAGRVRDRSTVTDVPPTATSSSLVPRTTTAVPGLVPVLARVIAVPVSRPPPPAASPSFAAATPRSPTR